MVFEVRGAISGFANAVRKVPGLELVDEEELASDDDDKAPVAYLMVPDAKALGQIESLWKRWLSGQLVRGETPWRDVFARLRDLRPWGAQDRVRSDEREILSEEIGGRAPQDMVRLEIELVYRANAEPAAKLEAELKGVVEASGGRVIFQSRIDEIAYHALLVETSTASIQAIIDNAPGSLATAEGIMHIRPQSVATGLDLDTSDEPEAETASTVVLREPILAVIDGVPVAGHNLISQHVIVDDQHDLEPGTPTSDRVHGTAMVSLVVHGDKNVSSEPLGRQIHVVPVLGAADRFPEDRLIIDMIYTTVVTMREGAGATAPGVIIVNISLGNARRRFHGSMSAWARLLDRMAFKYGILFVVSAGNCVEELTLEGFSSGRDFEDASAENRGEEVLRGLATVAAERRLLSPAESINSVTVGAANLDGISDSDRALARTIVDPFGSTTMANPSSALGPGFASSVKPDVLLPGGREHLRLVRTHTHIDVVPAPASRFAGLKVASPPRLGRENSIGHTSGTSAATALASRTAHRIHDALEATYGEGFALLPGIQRAALLKALLVHPARWPEDTAGLIRKVVGPADGRLHVLQKDNIRRFLGFGLVDSDTAVACAADRATFWAVGSLDVDSISTVDVPIPACFGGKARPHSLTATLAWFTPVVPGRKVYRSVRLKLLEPSDLASLRLAPYSQQPDTNQTNRGTVFTRTWKGDRAAVVGQNATFRLTVQRDPDQGADVDEPVSYGLAVTIEMPGVSQVYDQIRQRLAISARARA